MQLPLVLLSLLGAAVGLGDMPPVPDLVEIAENSVHGVLSPPTVEEPKVWLPTIAQIKAMTDEERADRFHWFLFVFVLVFFSIVCTGTLVMVVGAEVKALGNSYYGLGQTAPLSKEAQIKLVGLSFVVTVSLSFTATLWSLQTGRLSKKLGLDWEVYLLLFCCGCLSLLIQSVVAVAWLKAGARFDTTAFAVASMSILPVFSDQFDTLKDIIFGALCYQSEQYAIQLLGVLSWLYLLAFHAWFFLLAGSNPIKGTPGANCFSELATSHLSVLLTAPKVDGESSAGFWEGTILPTLYKQLTPSKRQYLLIENLPQAVLSILFLCFEGGSIFVVILNLAVPAVQIGLTLILFQPVRAAAAPALSKALNRAVSNGNAIAAKTIWEEAEVGRDIQLFQQMLPRLRFVLDFVERSGFKELDKLSEVELQLLQGIASMFVQAWCNLSGKKIGDAGAKVVAQALKDTATEVLFLAGNEIGDDGAQALADGLKSNGSLTILGLHENSIGDAGAEALADSLKSNGSLKTLGLQMNSIGPAGAEALGDGLKSNGSLQSLVLTDNSIGDAGAQALADGLKSNGSLQKLELRNNSIGDAGLEALAAGITENRSLWELHLDTLHRYTPGGQALEEAEKMKIERGEDFGICWY